MIPWCGRQIGEIKRAVKAWGSLDQMQFTIPDLWCHHRMGKIGDPTMAFEMMDGLT